MTTRVINPQCGYGRGPGTGHFDLWLLLCLSFTNLLHAETNPDYQFHLGEKYYSDGRYDKAIEAFSAAIEIAPAVSVYHYWLAKSYGRLAEKSNIFKAYILSGKTRTELEQAVALDNTNVDALSDLMEYYDRAPAFLGGGRDKAEVIRQRLRELGHVSGGA